LKMMLTEQFQDSTLAMYESTPQTTLLTYGEYTFHPMQFCAEKDVAKLFTKVCQRGNPVLQGRPFADLELLGKAMYRKSTKLGMGQVAMHKGKLVALGCCWDAAEGGVWQDSGLEMPASLAAHAACGKACFDAVPKRDRRTLFCAFYGVAPPHSAHCFGIMAMSHFVMAQQMGFEDSFQFTLLPTLKGKGVFSDSKTNNDSMNWAMKFTDVKSERAEVLAELQELGGSINLQVTSISYSLGDEYLQLGAATVRMKPAELLRHRTVAGSNHLKWLQSFDCSWSEYMAQGNGNGHLMSRL
jgi:hypothetical protein